MCTYIFPVSASALKIFAKNSTEESSTSERLSWSEFCCVRLFDVGGGSESFSVTMFAGIFLFVPLQLALSIPGETFEPQGWGAIWRCFLDEKGRNFFDFLPWASNGGLAVLSIGCVFFLYSRFVGTYRSLYKQIGVAIVSLERTQVVNIVRVCIVILVLLLFVYCVVIKLSSADYSH